MALASQGTRDIHSNNVNAAGRHHVATTTTTGGGPAMDDSHFLERISGPWLYVTHQCSTLLHMLHTTPSIYHIVDDDDHSISSTSTSKATTSGAAKVAESSILSKQKRLLNICRLDSLIH
jgi:hypothetical protein